MLRLLQEDFRTIILNSGINYTKVFVSLSLLLIGSPNPVYGQTNTTVEYQNQYGQKIGGARITSTPTNRTRPYQGTPFVSGVPIERIIATGTRLQEKYDARVKWLQNKIVVAANHSIEMRINWPEQGQLYYSKVSAFADKINRNHYNLVNNSVFVPLANEISAIEEEIQRRSITLLNQGAKVSDVNDEFLDKAGAYKYASLFTNSPASGKFLIGATREEIMRVIEYNNNVTSDFTSAAMGLPFIGYEVGDVGVEYFFPEDGSTKCFRYRVVTPLIHKDYIENVLTKSYAVLNDSTFYDASSDIIWKTSVDQEYGTYYIRALRRDALKYPMLPKK